jgi:hypothetical protein
MNYELLKAIETPRGIFKAGTIVRAVEMKNYATGEIYYNCCTMVSSLGFFKVKPSDLEKC